MSTEERQLQGLHADVLGIRNARAKIEGAMTLLGVEGYGTKRILQLSGGNRKKVEVAKAFLTESPVILLDEPTNELDLASRNTVWQRIRALSSRGSAVVMVSHDMNEILALAHRVLELDEGVLRTDERRASHMGDASGTAYLLITFEK
ncbi:MAG: ATP-binding cassette domain-containing protein [Bacillota bacterium]